MTVSKKLIENVGELKKALNEISVYDFDVYTSMELYYKIAEKLNEVIKELSRFEGAISDEVVQQNEKLLYLLGEGLTEEVIKKINQMVNDGTMDAIVNHNVFNSLNLKVNENRARTDGKKEWNKAAEAASGTEVTAAKENLRREGKGTSTKNVSGSSSRDDLKAAQKANESERQQILKSGASRRANRRGSSN